MTYGTSNFLSETAAIRYYATQGINKAEVKRKIAEHLISIGEPKVKRGQKLLINKEEGRYFIQTNK